MPKLTTIDAKNLKVIGDAIEAALLGVAKEYGLQPPRVRKGTYFTERDRAEYKLEVVLDGGLVQEQHYYEQLRRDIHPDFPARGAEFTSGQGRAMSVWGANSTGSQVICEDEQGRKYTYRTNVFMVAYREGTRAKANARR